LSVKTVAAVNDLSGVGRCSLTVAMPVISAMGAQVCPAPTAILSAHTGFKKIVATDMTTFLTKMLDAWTNMGMLFDCIYTGYLGSPRQAELILGFMNKQSQALKVVDPVMGDEGKLYSGVDSSMVEAMRALCRAADVATPNMTEFSSLAGEEYAIRPRTRAKIDGMLSKLPSRAAVITSVPYEDGLANAYRDFSGETGVIPFEAIDGHYPGTGDLFASVLTGALVTGDNLKSAVERAADFVSRAMTLSRGAGDPNHGVQLEAALPYLLAGRA
jgi:pyridoxine kinase